MPKIGVSYYSRSGNTQKMAEFVSGYCLFLSL